MPAEIALYWWLVPVGLLVGAVGTLIGAGGGFLLAPLLLFVYRDAPPETIASISLTVVFFNAASGSYAYAKKKRIDFKSGLIFCSAAVPGAVAGALTTPHLPREWFEGIFAVFLVAAGIYLFLNPAMRERPPMAGRPGCISRTLVDVHGVEHSYTYHLWVAIAMSFGVGFVSSLLGVGGGFIHVPAMIYVLYFPVHIATATSHFVLAVTALVGSGVHIAQGGFSHGGLWRVIFITIGVLPGAQVGAAISARISGNWIFPRAGRRTRGGGREDAHRGAVGGSEKGRSCLGAPFSRKDTPLIGRGTVRCPLAASPPGQ